MIKKTTEYLFNITGGIDVDSTLIPEESQDGEIIGFTTNDTSSASTVRLVMALEIENPDGSFSYVTKSSDMEDLGFRDLVYSGLEFYEVTKPQINEGGK